MAQLHETVDTNEYEGAIGLTVLPDGEYLACVVTSEEKPNSKRTGHYYELMFQVLQGPHAGANFWSRLNLDNPNALAVRLAKQELTALAEACGKKGEIISDTEMLHNIPVVCRLAVKEGVGNYGDTNEIKAYAPAPQGAAAPPAAPPPTPQASAAPPAAGSKPVWET